MNKKKKDLNKKEMKKKKLEPMIDCKYPTIASGATSIESADRAPDKELFRRARKKISSPLSVASTRK
jgi:hypothetical protein